MNTDVATLPNLVLALFQVLMLISYGIAQNLFKIKNKPFLLAIVCLTGILLIFLFVHLFPGFTPEEMDPFYIMTGQFIGFVLLFFLCRKAK